MFACGELVKLEKKDHQQQALKAALYEKTDAAGEKVKDLKQEVLDDSSDGWLCR